MPGLFEQFPHTNLHELNLDWIIDLLNQFKEELEDSAVLSVNGQTGHVTLYESENVILPALPEGVDQWRLVRLVNGQYVGILFHDNHAYLQRGNSTMRLLTLEDIPTDAGVVSWNGLTGVVNVTGQDIPVDDSADADSIEQAITTEITERTNEDNAIRNQLTAMSSILANTPQNATQMPMSGSDTTKVADAISALQNKINSLSLVHGTVGSNSSVDITLDSSSSVVIFVAGNGSSKLGAYLVKSNSGSTAAYLLELASGGEITATTSNDQVHIANASTSGGAFIHVLVLEGGAHFS